MYSYVLMTLMTLMYSYVLLCTDDSHWATHSHSHVQGSLTDDDTDPRLIHKGYTLTDPHWQHHRAHKDHHNTEINSHSEDATHTLIHWSTHYWWSSISTRIAEQHTRSTDIYRWYKEYRYVCTGDTNDDDNSIPLAHWWSTSTGNMFTSTGNMIHSLALTSSTMYTEETEHYSLLTACCTLLTHFSSLLTACCTLLTTHCSLLTAHFTLHTTHCSLTSPLYSLHCTLLTACCLLLSDLLNSQFWGVQENFVFIFRRKNFKERSKSQYRYLFNRSGFRFPECSPTILCLFLAILAYSRPRDPHFWPLLLKGSFPLAVSKFFTGSEFHRSHKTDNQQLSSSRSTTDRLPAPNHIKTDN